MENRTSTVSHYNNATLPIGNSVPQIYKLPSLFSPGIARGPSPPVYQPQAITHFSSCQYHRRPLTGYPHDMTNYSNASRSYEPTISGFGQMPEDRDRESKAILVRDSRQYNKLKAIEGIDPVYLEPWGWLPRVQDPDTKRFPWQRRTPDGPWPEVWCRINQGCRDIEFEIQFSRHDYCVAHVPIESWELRTCNAEAVRAAIQQDYLNRLRRVSYHASIVKRGMKSLPLHPWDEFKSNPKGKWFKPIPLPSFAREQVAYDAPRSSVSSTTEAWVRMHAPSDQRRRYRPQQSRSPISSPASSRAPQYPEVYDYRRYYDTSDLGSPSSGSSRTLVDSHLRYDFEGGYSDASSLTETHSIPPPPLRSEKHSFGLARNFRSGSERASIYSERKRWWERALGI